MYRLTVKEKILEMLADRRGEYVSGEHIAEQLAVSRAAVWKVVKSLQEEGYEITAGTNRGYLLVPDADILSRGTVLGFLPKGMPELDIRIYGELESTNITAKELAENGAAEGVVVMAERQNSGKGRIGRSFFSPEGGMYMSVILRPKFPASQALMLTTAAAAATAAGIEEVSGKKTGIKWVNDVFIDGKKVCGILTEAALSLENDGVDYAVVGIGVNVYAPQGGYPPDIGAVATSVFDKRERDARARVAAAILGRFMAYYRKMPEKSFYNDYASRLFFLGKEINVVHAGTSRRATALDIDENFALRVRYGDGSEEKLSSGEISIRIAE